MKNIKHWLFDFDGTLVDSMPHWGAAMVGILDNHGIPHDDDIIKTITPLGTKGTIEHFIKLGLDMSLEDIKAEIFSVLVPLYRDVIVDKPHVRECLLKMRAAGMHLHILTASPHVYLDPCLKRIGLYDLFDNVWSSDDFGTGKTDPKIYIAAAERIGASVSGVAFLDDNIHADLTAKSAGMRVVGVYDDTSADSEAQMRSVLDGYVRDFSELAEILGI
jgi:HAD superfamily hydrolase (TIGR01509 family)